MAKVDNKAASPLAEDLAVTVMKGLRESAFLFHVGISLFLLVALMTFNPGDPGWSHSGGNQPIINAAGRPGAWLADFLLSLFGVTAYLFPFLVSGYAYTLFKDKINRDNTAGLPFYLRWLGFGMAVTAGAALVDMYQPRFPISLPETSGGILGQETADLLAADLGGTGTTIILIVGFLVGVSLHTRLSWLAVVDGMGRFAMQSVNLLFSPFAATLEAKTKEKPSPKTDAEPATSMAQEKKERVSVTRPPETKPHIVPPAPAVKTPVHTPEPTAKRHTSVLPSALPNEGQLPPLELLNDQAPKVKAYSDEALEQMSELVESILADFGVQVRVTEVHPGPVITRFEVQPSPGVKASRITGLARDLARALSVTSVRVVEIIPGKTVIGLEIPNEEREMVLLHSVIASDVYQQMASPLTMVLGKDIGGGAVVANLARMPHLLVAGTTGSGKSVAVNVMILSMLYKARPDEVRLIMIDPKMLELSIYEGIPHLLTPVVTDMKEAANALRWCVAEMERRYKLMSMVGVRNLHGYNQKIAEAKASGQALTDPLAPGGIGAENVGPPELSPLPYIVIVIDELADMMMIVGKKVEELIARLAQKARAAGLHLILATQRPSVDVLTGLIKANIPTRISFQVSSRIDSRTIIDQGGAEALLGNGDMLYLPSGSGLPMRAHGAFVSDQEVHHVVEFLKTTGHSQYIEEITRFTEEASDVASGKYSGGGSGAEGGEDTDALYNEAVRFVVESRKASISSVQRRFKVGYN
ncbi:MAG: DNA translocase FtsK, partial [Methylococcaceae bacterium]